MCVCEVAGRSKVNTVQGNHFRREKKSYVGSNVSKSVKVAVGLLLCESKVKGRHQVHKSGKRSKLNINGKQGGGSQ